MSNAETVGLLRQIAGWCRTAPSQPAICWRGRTLAYAELERRALRISTALKALPGTAPRMTAVLLSDRIHGVGALLGVFAADAVFAALDPDLPRQRLEILVEELSPACFLADDQTLPLAAALARGAKVLNLDELPEDAAGSLDMELDEDALRYICFTSGSTGRPKGIAGRLKGLTHFIRWESEALCIREGIRTSHLSPPTFDVMFRDVLLPLSHGGCVCIPPERPAHMTGSDLLEWLEREQVELVHCVPSLFSGLVENIAPGRLPHLQYVLLAGENIPVTLLKQWTTALGWRVRLLNLYGPSETTMVKFAHTVCPEDLERGFIPIGKPLPGARAILLDSGNHPCPPGVVGEIHIRSPYMSLGYYRQPELTAQAFIPNPFGQDPADLVYRTGDMARVLPDGSYQFLGRRDRQVKVRGNRVEIGEIENQLLQCTHVRQAAVAVLDEPVAPAGGAGSAASPHLAAYVAGATELKAEELREELRRRLPEYMLPTTFTLLPRLPLTATGKLDRNALPPPETTSVPVLSDQTPRTPAESAIAGIWKEVLKRETVGIHGNFFDLGGHSLLATQVVARIRRAFQVDFHVRTLFERPTVAGQALAVAELQARGNADIAGLLAEIEQSAGGPT